ncbi:MAG: type I restriction endonuclease subunit R [Methanoregulaceae archaeon]|nr:type I restriction endonuclease subunit R [Methanoregulaceae archaeon]
MSSFVESHVEEAALDWLGQLGYQVIYGPDIQPEGPYQERATFGEVLLIGRLQTALARLNPTLPADALDQALRKVLAVEGANLIDQNRNFHRLLVDGISVDYRTPQGDIRHDLARVIDFDDVSANDWLACNQLTVTEGKFNRRPDVVLFLNGIPIATLELKNAADANATVQKAWQQLQTYKQEIPLLFVYDGVLAISDGLDARGGTISADFERFAPWRTADGINLAPKGVPMLETQLRGMFDRQRLLDLIRNFVVFESDGEHLIKKLAAYHQYFAVNKALECTLEATAATGDRRIGVVWHTQGSGKSLSMVFYAGKVIQHPVMENPTLVVVTDRNDLDDQLFQTFARCSDLLRQTPVQAENRGHLRELLSVNSGGVIFTTIQKFQPDERGDILPVLTSRRNVVVIADEAHRSQYGFSAKLVEGEVVYGYAKHMRDALPNASYIGFTGTPIEGSDRSTPAVFGDYIDVYDIQRAVEDNATVPIYYEARLAKLALAEEEKPKVDDEFEEVTEGEEDAVKNKLKSKWARLEAMVGAEHRLELVAKDIVDHFENRLAAMDGKGMIVCMSRRICIDLYNEIIKLRPDWHSEDDDKGTLKVIMTGSATDPLDWQQHIRNKARREHLAGRYRNPKEDFKLVIVRDMWLTGFDAPSMHTMYLDKPMKSHGLMQAIARVNRVFKDKPGGLVVDYLGLADQLKAAMKDYTESGGKGDTTVDIEEAVARMLELFEVVEGIMHGFAWSHWSTLSPGDRLSLIAAGMEHVLAQEDGAKRYVDAVTKLAKAFALAMPHDEALRVREDVAFFQAVKGGLVKYTISTGPGQTQAELDAAIRQIVAKAVVSDEVIDIFAAAGLKKPDIGILSEEFLEEVRQMPHRNLALELLRKLMSDEIRSQSKKNVVQARSFSEMLEQVMRSYQARSITAAQVIAELIELAKEMNEAKVRGEQLGLSDDEVAFYDALEVNDSAVAILGDEALRQIARELVEVVKRSVSIDWTSRESVKANLRRMVRRVLRANGYPPDKQEKAVETVLLQAETLAADWAS